MIAVLLALSIALAVACVCRIAPLTWRSAPFVMGGHVVAGAAAMWAAAQAGQGAASGDAVAAALASAAWLLAPMSWSRRDIVEIAREARQELSP
ncbi:hypothetical protein [Pseudaquabacterium rugosum]|jgi:hypothetical protein|uniref:Uncharacterized protein n=1 Tax=Pseudaquabacterium rugosum TaxID=2984194 RepID=A0ABU9B564_9BURK